MNEHVEMGVESQTTRTSNELKELSASFIGSLRALEKLHTILNGNGMFIQDCSNRRHNLKTLPRAKMRRLVDMLSELTKQINFISDIDSFDAADMFDRLYSLEPMVMLLGSARRRRLLRILTNDRI